MNIFNPTNTLAVTVIALILGLILFFWHERISGYFAKRYENMPGRNPYDLQSGLDQFLFLASIAIVVICSLWLLRIFAA